MKSVMPVSTLGDAGVAEITLGQSPPSSALNSIGEGLPFFQGKADFGRRSPTARVWCTVPERIAEAGDVLLSVRAPVGAVNVAVERCAIGRGVAAVRAGTRADRSFLPFAVQAIRRNLEARATGSTFESVNKAALLETEVPLPSLPEQRAIAVALNLCLDAIDAHDAACMSATRVKVAATSELFSRGVRGESQQETEIGPIPETWDLVGFSAVREFLQYGTSVRCTYGGGQYPVLRIPNIETGRIKATDLKYCDITPAEAARYELRDGDLLFIRTNGVIERLGTCAVYAGDPAKALFASYLIRARLKDGADPRFVAQYLGSRRGTSVIAERATPAADGKFNLNTSIIDSLPLPLPPTLDEQREIAGILDTLDRKIDLHKRKRALLEELFKSLLQKLMSGEIRVADLDLSALPQPVAS